MKIEDINNEKIELICKEYPDLSDDDFQDAAQNAFVECEGMTYYDLFAASCEGIRIDRI